MITRARQKNTGFSIIELLVVIIVIGIIATVILNNVFRSEAQARDSKRISELKTLSLALDAFFIEYGRYPCAGDSGDSPIFINPGSHPTLSDSSLLGTTFLDGATNGSGPCGISSPFTPLYGLFTEGIINDQNIQDPRNEILSGVVFNSNAIVYGYLYTVRAPRREYYVLQAHMESIIDIPANDGGQYAHCYEIGPGIQEWINGDWNYPPCSAPAS